MQEENQQRARAGPEVKDTPRQTENSASSVVWVPAPDMAQVLRVLLSPGSQAMHIMIPNIIKLAQIAAVLPLTTAACERGFSTLKREKRACATG